MNHFVHSSFLAPDETSQREVEDSEPPLRHPLSDSVKKWLLFGSVLGALALMVVCFITVCMFVHMSS